MLKPEDLIGQKSKLALKIIQQGGDYLETVEALEELQEVGNLTEVEEIGMLIEGYMLQNAPDPDQVEADLRAELDAIARGD